MPVGSKDTTQSNFVQTPRDADNSGAPNPHYSHYYLFLTLGETLLPDTRRLLQGGDAGLCGAFGRKIIRDPRTH